MAKEQQSYYIGKQVQEKRALLKERRPMEAGRVDLDLRDNCDDILRLLEHGVSQLGDGTADMKKLVFIEPTHVTKQEREAFVKLLFDTKKVEELWMASSPPLSLFASGRTTGCVIEAGESNATVVPILEGHPVARCKWGISDLTGQVMTNELDSLLKQNGRLSNREMLKQHMLRDIKEEHCYCSLNRRDDEHQAETDPTSLARVYELPDGRCLELGEERFRCGEVYFNPSTQALARLSGPKVRGIHLTAIKSIMSCHERLQPKLFQNIVPCGGVTLTHFFRPRLQQELNFWLTESEEGIEAKRNFKFTKPVQLVTPENCDLKNRVCMQAWRGGAILSQLSSFDSLKITAGDYKESGAGCAHRKQMVPARKGQGG